MEFDQSIGCTVKLVLVAPYTCSQGPDVISSSGQWAPLLLVHYGYSCLVLASGHGDHVTTGYRLLGGYLVILT